MSTCEEQIYSNDYFDFLIEKEIPGQALPGDFCVQTISERYSVLHVSRERAPELTISNYSYGAIPKCFTLVDELALESSGIVQLQNIPNYPLYGEGVLMGFVDTGIAYQQQYFRNPDGSSRIVAIWDQTIPGGAPQGFLFGTEYRKEQLDEALRSEKPLEVVSSRDENGHGTYVAGLAAGSVDADTGFRGAVPNASIAVVKLKQAKNYLREFYFIPEDAVAYEENDVMLAVSYLLQLAREMGMPLVITVALGTNMGNHSGNGYIEDYLNEVATRPGIAVVIAAGNEGSARHHYRGRMDSNVLVEQIEINVEAGLWGFTAELWSNAPWRYKVAVVSPTGERLPATIFRTEEYVEYEFLLEKTRVRIDQRQVGREEGDQLLYIRFEKPTRGIWVLEVSMEDELPGEYHIWLPMRELLTGEVYFLESSPDTTVTIPGTARICLTVGGYRANDGSLYLASGRGFNTDGVVKPELVAPAVDVLGPSYIQGLVARTGTSVAAAICAGASAMVLEWATIQEGYHRFNTVELKNFLIRGAGREEGREYPSREWGWGKLNVYEAFLQLRNK